jgi:hypothetical protein
MSKEDPSMLIYPGDEKYSLPLEVQSAAKFMVN